MNNIAYTLKQSGMGVCVKNSDSVIGIFIEHGLQKKKLSTTKDVYKVN